MGNDIEIRVRVANQTAGGLAAVNASLRTLKSNARDAGQALNGLNTRAVAATAGIRTLDSAVQGLNRSLRTLRGRAAAADAALRDLRTASTNSSNSLRTLNTRAQTATTRLGDLGDRTRTLRSDTDDLDGSMRRLTGTLGQLRGNLGTLRVSSSGAGGGMNGLRRAALLLSPALIPIAAAAAPIAGSLLTAATAVGVFGLAIGGQIAAMAKASEAEKKYREAVKEHGAASSEAATAEAAYLKQVRQMDPATRRAAAAFSVFKDQYKAWTQSVAGDTMPVLTKSFATFGGLLPRLTPLVRATSSELDRMMTVLAGGVNSGGFDRLMHTFAEFAGGTLSKATDGLVRFMRSMSEGGGSSQFGEFMAYVREVGPQVGQALGNLARALGHVVAAASDVGGGILAAVNAFAQLVNAIPTDILSTLLQFVVVFKLIKTAAMGLAGGAGGITAFSASLTAMQAASTAAGGGLAGLAAAFGALSKAAKVSVIAAGIGLAVVAISKLAGIGKSAPPDVDRLTTALGKLGSSGKVTGEAARVFGKDLDGLYDKVRNITDPSLMDQLQNGLVKVFTLGQVDSTASKQAQEALDAIDDGLVNLVKGGNADLAAAALDKFAAAYAKTGKDASKFRNEMDEYKDAVADLKFEQELAASAMGLFGQQSLAVGDKLAAQKASADGLRQAIQALADTHRAAFDAETKFEAAVDAAGKALKDNGATLDVNTEKGRANRDALSALAAATHEAAAASRESTGSWEGSIAVYERGRRQFIKSAEAMGLSRAEARKLADELVNIPDKTMRLKMDKEDAQRGLDAFAAAVKRSPSSKSVTLKTLSKSAEGILEAFGFKVKRLPNGKVTVTAITGGALGRIAAVKAARDSLRDKTITITTHYRITGQQARRSGSHGTQLGYASGGHVRGYADGGEVQAVPQGGYIQGPGSGTSDSILALMGSGALARVSNTEYVIQARAVQKYGTRLLDALNEGRLKIPGFHKGGHVTKAESEARKSARGDLTISHFGQMAGHQRSEFRSALAKPDSMRSLIDALNQWRAIIMKATHGGVEKALLKELDKAGKKLLAYQKQLEKVSASLEKSRQRLDELKQAASQLRDSVKSNILSSANITRSQGDGPVTVGSVMRGLTASRDQAAAFADALRKLQEKGLSSALIQQIAEAGIDGGGLQTAGALLNASASEIRSMNDLQAQISRAAGEAGKTAADSVYGGAIKMQEKLVAKLAAQQERLMKSMDKLAAAMEKAIEKAFGQKAAGGIVGAAASGGARGSWTLVGEHEPELVRLPYGSRVYSGPDTRRMMQQPAWASNLNTPRGAGRARHESNPAPDSGQPIVLNVALGGREFGQIWVDIGRKEVKTRGGLAATLGGP